MLHTTRRSVPETLKPEEALSFIGITGLMRNLTPNVKSKAKDIMFPVVHV